MSTTWVALVRGINVGRAKRIAMPELRTMLTSLGYVDVRTHGQSGNAIFTSGQRKAEVLEREISSGIRASFAMDASVLVRSAAEFVSAVEANPFAAPGVPSSELHFCFLDAQPAAAKTRGVDPDSYKPDEFAFGKRVVYVRLPNGIMGSTLPDWERTLGVRATQRNWNTTTKLRDLVG